MFKINYSSKIGLLKGYRLQNGASRVDYSVGSNRQVLIEEPRQGSLSFWLGLANFICRAHFSEKSLSVELGLRGGEL